MTPRRHETRRKPKSAARSGGREAAKYNAETTNARSTTTLPMMLTAGVGWAKLDPAAEPMTSTMITATSPRASPSTIAAGTIQSFQSGWSSDGPVAGPGGSATAGSEGGGTLVIAGSEVRGRLVSGRGGS